MFGVTVGTFNLENLFHFQLRHKHKNGGDCQEKKLTNCVKVEQDSLDQTSLVHFPHQFMGQLYISQTPKQTL